MADMWENIKNIVGKSAPVLGNAIVPGIGGVAGSLVAKMLGCSATPEDIEAAIKKDPEIALKLKELEIKHEQFLITSSHENDKLYIGDVQDARAREVALTNATGELNWPMYLLGGLIVIGFFATIGCLFSIELIAFNKELIIYTVGGLQSAFLTIVAYLYGSSKGSSDKNKIIEKTKNILEK